MIREWDGGVISAGYGKLENVGEAFHAEIIACLQGIQRAADLGMQRMILETDASMVAQAMKSTDYESFFSKWTNMGDERFVGL